MNLNKILIPVSNALKYLFFHLRFNHISLLSFFAYYQLLILISVHLGVPLPLKVTNDHLSHECVPLIAK